ncbi:hypothetical protein UFOVP1228_11 [uncultured Caudovirales phage]|uniref:AP2/ERF domain-containing protein n=1 Tax=uncultured Caudovirales phage TaxID=2100421 RepID=A0A6J5RBN7_9CAUD|nr:hypothetical protein UFOVP956_11 [uncultured Caudovirales phage]CAB4191148.1 hypothetical protein UFOVP1228_11 [uncultured Caudovirales phage]CAB4215466.1 hypothetical protein UFOVP1481_27 [uncultured Caudovirales phage]
MRGACFDKSKGRWRAFIYVDAAVTWLGCFPSEEEAHLWAIKAEEILPTLDPSLTSKKILNILHAPDGRKVPWTDEHRARHRASHQKTSSGEKK